ncbi:L-seryl-tRNA selenium transferase [Campylobacter sp. RM9344]|uniref:L-seryl-tRNA selenium transferase n=1 Tax=Campylobacter californiensis TaxID=1032243 RepID=A0AAW3ZXL9_9BACT|nr:MULTISPECIES: L-seryl-tRNA selenium transferase [unclassified Campylobacter]MBE2985123.1 L-seryl-tRNA selenium transferase [Campylobacter sp. RM6883]MBE2986412.1 L-seryl-tRNA selenium transferase [Campylobacter sp. RM12919]MBE2988716.1 L-seryl-tRNA selenium transferase [Campylobacter sp. RM12920]MBE2995714.1 L-seryl-tRNA selenium transferase [Campylobacter sp. RM6913]MBE3022811.1 L-seryl-tRNA selenium transferase [Campylobacter sp. 7477a]MBE3029998.1 L-seryl-tRNA selenium transferase [Camp
MKKAVLFLTLAISLTFVGCGTKRQYFEPESVNKEISLSHDLPSYIKSVNPNGATLKNGNIITKDGLDTSIKLAKGFELLNKSEDAVISSNINGDLNVSDTSGNTLYFASFKSAIVSASLEGNLLAAVSAANQIYLIDIFEAKTLMQYKSSEIYSVDSRVVSPYFMSSLIIYPSLDGRIYIVQKDSGRILRDVVVSSEPFFNNIIFLDVIGENMIAATAKKLIVINPQRTLYYDAEIKNILANDENIYIFKKDGNVVLTDLGLRVKNERNFKFAIFSDALATDNYLYIVEKTGYIFRTDLDLNNPEIYEFDSEIEDKSFMGKDAFYYDDEFVNFK